MENKYLLSLDLSTTCTGWSLFDIKKKTLVTYGILRPTTRGGVNKLDYPKKQLVKMLDLSEQILELVSNYKPVHIVIEEISGSKNRLGQKVLDGFHFVLVKELDTVGYLDMVSFQDVTGSDGWRPRLGIRLTDEDKKANREAQKLNKSLPRDQRLPKITNKHTVCRYVNFYFKLDLDVDQRATDGDIADSVAMGWHFLSSNYKQLIKY